MKQQTTLQELISELQKGYDYLNGLSDDYNEGQKVAYWAAIQKATELLERERNVIIEAWNAGDDWARHDICELDDLIVPASSAENYYNKKFTNK